MKSRETLVLIEIVIMIGIFAAAAGLCLRVFAFAGQESLKNDARDHAVTEASNAAEVLIRFAGDFDRASAVHGGISDGGVWVIRYDDEWNRTPDRAVYLLTAEPENATSGFLGKAVITVTDEDGEILFRIPAAWQRTEAAYE